jgi:hypothetical protein
LHVEDGYENEEQDGTKRMPHFSKWGGKVGA